MVASGARALALAALAAATGSAAAGAGPGDVAPAGEALAGRAGALLGCSWGGETKDLECVLRGLFDDASGPGGRWGGLFDDELGPSGTYGELQPEGFESLRGFLAKSGEPFGAGDLFVDLGSGRGGALLSAALTTPAQALGVELSRPRHEAAERAVARLAAAAPEAAARIRAVQGDLRISPAWHDATVVFMNSACYTPRLMLDVAEALGRWLAPGALVLSIRKLPGCARGFRKIGAVTAAFTWSRKVPVHIYVAAPRPYIYIYIYIYVL